MLRLAAFPALGRPRYSRLLLDVGGRNGEVFQVWGSLLPTVPLVQYLEFQCLRGHFFFRDREHVEDSVVPTLSVLDLEDLWQFMTSVKLSPSS